MVRNEINVLKKVSTGHPNIVTLHDVRLLLLLPGVVRRLYPR